MQKKHPEPTDRDDTSDLIAAAPKLNGKVIRIAVAEHGLQGGTATDYAFLSASVNAACDKFFESRGIKTMSLRDQINNFCRNHNRKKRRVRKDFLDDFDVDLVEHTT